MLVLQSCTDPLQVMAGSSTETFPTSSDGTYDIGNINFEEIVIKQEVEEHIDINDIDVKEDEEEEEEVNVKTEKGIDIKVEDCIYSEEENEEDIDKQQEEEVVEIKEEVS